VSGDLDELYFTWLYSQIGDVKQRDPARTYWNLARLLYKKEFVWLVPNDDNRLEDGKDLRMIFLHDSGITPHDPNWMELGCSTLEMLIALSHRLSFETNRKVKGWFWRLMDNLELETCTDGLHKMRWLDSDVEDIIDRLMWRNYEHDGSGGLFPLEHPHQDQREVEIWYQLNAYLLEHG
jgi:hypothetical protein